MLERVHLGPELVAFESVIRERVTRLATFEDDRFARPSRVERDPVTGELTVLAEFITGSRLSDLLEATADAAIVPGVDVALGYLLESLPALTLLHTIGGVTHGLIEASRTILTPDGQVVFLDAAFASAVERLNLSRGRLWAKFGVASPSGNGSVQLDATSDISQVALGAVALVLGRNLRPDEYPEALPSLLMEVIEVAQIRGNPAFATGLQRFLQRSLPIPGRRPYTTADEAVIDVRQLVRRDIGVEVCRQAVIDFAAQMDTAFAAPDGEAPREHSARDNAAAHSPRVAELDEFLDSFDHTAEAEEPETSLAGHSGTSGLDATDESNETELSLDSLDTDAPIAAARDVEEIYDLPPLDEVMAEANMLPPTPPSPAPMYSAPVRLESPPVRTFDESATTFAAEFPFSAATEPAVAEIAEPLRAPEPPIERSVSARAQTTVEPVAAVQHVVAPEPPPVVEAPAAIAAEAPSTPQAESESESEKDTASSRRRKRQQQKSARARKDKLRSTTTVQKAAAPPPPPPVPEPARPTSPTGWLVSPQRAAQFEPPVPTHYPAPPPPPMRPAPVAVPAVPSFVPTPVGPLPQPVYPSSVGSASAYGTPSAPTPARPGPLAPPPVIQAPQSNVQVKVKVESPAGFATRRSPITEPQEAYLPDRFGTLGLGRSEAPPDDEPRAFPWKLAAVAVAVAAFAIIMGRTYLPGRTAVPGEPGAQVDQPASTSAAPSTQQADPVDTPIPAGRGRLVVVTQPAGIKVLLDRKPAGETPVTIDAPPGRRILTFITSGGEVIRSVRIVAGKTESLDIPVFSGWIAVFAPIVLDVAADGKSIGNTEQSRLMLPPGRHKLTLSNKDLGYSASQDVEIEPGEVKSINIEPRGPVNFNATPWAEVWLDGQKLGDTPLAATPVPLGLREFVFKNPQFPERKVGATIKASGNSPVFVDFAK